MALKKVLLLMPDYGVGGAQRVFSDQSKFLSAHFEVTLCTFNNDSVDTYHSAGRKIALNVKAGTSVPDKIRLFYQRVKRLREIKKDFDLCISHLEGADYVNLLAGGKAKTICCIHGTKFHDGEIKGAIGWIRKKILMPVLYQRADLIVSVSSAIRDELISLLKIAEHKIKVINNGFDVKQIERKSQEPVPAEVKALFDHHLTVCLCSRLAPQKNQLAYIPVFAEVIPSVGSKLVFLGDGELRDDLIALAHSLGLRVYSRWGAAPFSDQFDVYFLGSQLNPFSYLSHASVFVLPSAWEGFPLALCEAMACGVPVISSDCPTGPREILDVASGEQKSEYGILLPIPSGQKGEVHHQWKEATARLLKDRKQAHTYAQKAKLRVTEFSMEKMENEWMAAIQSVLHE
ncbi:MAG: hypothetical protein DI538_03605 [Azospira oryzae]|jgi:glycosyltransferase involved in cell wall biosynthesis|nr:MAG: hypothetical protein DI538_03605 [Azospira oryzae]